MNRVAVVSITCVLGFSCLLPVAESRPKYRTEFETKYRPFLPNGRVTCGLCHKGQDKMTRNLYGQAIAKHIATNELDPQRIQEVLKIVDKEASHIPGKTWGELITGRKFPKPEPTPDPLPDPIGD